MSVDEIVDMLDYVTHVGLRVDDPHLNKIMDLERALAVRDIIVELRRKTGQDFGPDAELWIKKLRGGATDASRLTQGTNPAITQQKAVEKR